MEPRSAPAAPGAAAVVQQSFYGSFAPRRIAPALASSGASGLGGTAASCSSPGSAGPRQSLYGGRWAPAGADGQAAGSTTRRAASEAASSRRQPPRAKEGPAPTQACLLINRELSQTADAEGIL